MTITETEPTTEELLEAERAQTAFLQENLATLELVLSDPSWTAMGGTNQREMRSDSARRKANQLARVMATANPLIKRGLGLRAAYVWGSGVSVSCVDNATKGTAVDLDQVLQEFLEDNVSTFWDAQAQVDNERQLGTDGEVFIALPTAGGHVKVRSFDPDEITQVYTNPEDKTEVWYYQRDYVVANLDGSTGEQVSRLYPALGYYPAVQPDTITVNGKALPVAWGCPVRGVIVNRPQTTALRGVGDAYAALPWARADKEFLEDWALLMKALSSIAFQVKTKASKAAQAAREVAARSAAAGNPGGAAATIGMDPDSHIEAVPKSGATIDAESHKPLATYVAAALGVPLTMLLGDPGSTGARAVAETLDEPMRLEIGLRRKVWTRVFKDIGGYVLRVAALSGRVPGGVVDARTNRLTFAGGDDPTITVIWPEFKDVSVEVLVRAIVEADSAKVLPPLEILRLLAAAFEMEDVEDLIAQVTDADGNFLPADVRDEMAAQTQRDRGAA